MRLRNDATLGTLVWHHELGIGILGGWNGEMATVEFKHGSVEVTMHRKYLGEVDWGDEWI